MRHTAVLKSSRFSILCSLLAVAVLLSAAACKKDEAEAKPIVTVQTAVVQQTDLVQTVESEATLYPVNQAAITPKISAPVKQFYVNRGSRVNEGQLLAVLENSDLSASAIENRGTLEQARAAYSTATLASLPEEWKKAELDASAAKQLLDAEQKLYSSREELYKQGALPRKELDQAGVALTLARNQYEVAHQHLEASHAVGQSAQLKSAKAQLDSARGKFMGASAQLHYSEIHSPISGIVADRPLHAGETAPAGVPMLVIVDSSKIIAKAHLSQQQASLVKVGNAASITVPGEDQPIAAKVTVVSPAVDVNSTTIEVWTQADNPAGNLNPGASVHLSIAVAKIPAAVVIPSASVLTASEGKSSVLVVGQGSIAHLTDVRLGVQQGASTQIVEGLKPGETIVVSGAYGLPNGTHVQVAAPEDEAGKSVEKAD